MNKKLVGKVFETSWGYDQTNYDFVIVESVSPTGKTVMCRRARIDVVNEESSRYYDALKPKTEGYGKSFRLRVEKDNEDNLRLRGSYIYCGENSKRLGTLREVDENRTYAQTNTMFGH